MGSDIRLRVARIVNDTEAEGPGRRFALWVQGCHLRCAGCCNPTLFDPHGGDDVAVADIVERLSRGAPQLEGVTFLGGEPFEQAEALAEVARAAHRLELSVMTFTGHLLKDVWESPLARETDLLIDGPYDRNRPETERRWAGSTNQHFHFLTSRYQPGIERGRERSIEVRLCGDRVQINGWPDLARLRW